MKLVFHIGLHKTGTSWLQQLYFRAHPQICLISNSKHPWEDRLVRYIVAESDRHFDVKFCRDLLSQMQCRLETEPKEKVFVISAERLSGHPWSGGFDSFRIAERIGASFPETKIFCLLRRQLEMIESVYKELVAEGYVGHIRALLATESWKGVGFDWSFYEYDRLVEKYFDVFGREKVCFLPYEHLRENPDSFLRELCAFFGTEFFDSSVSRSSVNPSLTDAGASMIRRTNRFRRTELNPFPVIAAGEKFHRLVRYIGKRLPATRRTLDDELKERILEYYNRSNERLIALLGDSFRSYQGCP